MTTKQTIDQLVKDFFSLFDNTAEITPNLDKIYDLCHPDTLIIKNVDGNTETYSLDSFITPRKELLSNGTLTDFTEAEIEERTDVFGHMAQRFCIYEKSGKHKGKAFHSRGMKSFQFIQSNGEWKISSVVWDDENDQLKANLNKP